MKWSFDQLMKISSFPAQFSNTFDYSENVKKSESIIGISPVKVEGTIIKEDFDTYVFTYSIKCQLILPCSLTLEPVNYNMDLIITETYTNNQELLKDMKTDIYPFENNTLDLDSIIWSNIVVNIPIRVVRDDAYEILKERNIVFDIETPDKKE